MDYVFSEIQLLYKIYNALLPFDLVFSPVKIATPPEKGHLILPRKPTLKTEIWSSLPFKIGGRFNSPPPPTRKWEGCPLCHDLHQHHPEHNHDFYHIVGLF